MGGVPSDQGAVKLHFTLDHDGYLPTALVIPEGKQHEVTVARQQPFLRGTILILDRGYLDLAWFSRLTDTGVFFVTRMKDGAAYDVVKRHAVPERGGVVADEWIAWRTPLTRAVRAGPALAPRRSGAARRRSLGLSHESSRPWANDDRAHLQGPVANRAVLQGVETERVRQDVRQHLGQRAAHSGLDGADCPAPPQVLADDRDLRLVPVEPGRAAADESLRLSRSLDVAQRALPSPPRPPEPMQGVLI